MRKGTDQRWIWLLLAAAVTACIWQQSTLPRVESAQTSEEVREVVVTVLGGPTTTLGGFFDRFIRKIAHVTEFAALGLCLEAYYALRHTRLTDAIQLAVGAAVAANDEILQVFTARGAAVSDVLLDICGFVAATLLARLLIFIVFHIVKKRKAAVCTAAEEDDA